MLTPSYPTLLETIILDRAWRAPGVRNCVPPSRLEALRGLGLVSSLSLLVSGDRPHKGHRIWSERTWVQVAAQSLKSCVILDTHLMS